MRRAASTQSLCPRQRWLACALALLVGCKPNAAPSEPHEAPAAIGTPQPGAAQETAYVTGALTVRHEASEAKQRTPADHERKARSNFVAQLQRGERVELLAEEDGWAHIRTSDEQMGFVRREGLLAGSHIEPATLHRPQRMFKRPDLLALGPQPPLDPGSLVFVVRRKEQFCELNYAGQSTAWLLCAQLDTDPYEVDAAKLISRAIALDRAQQPGGDDLRSLARNHWGHTRLVRELLNEDLPPADDDAAADDPNAGVEHDRPQAHPLDILPSNEHPSAPPPAADEPLEAAP